MGVDIGVFRVFDNIWILTLMVQNIAGTVMNWVCSLSLSDNCPNAPGDFKPTDGRGGSLVRSN